MAIWLRLRIEWPERILQFFLRGYSQDPKAILTTAQFPEVCYDEMVLVKDIRFYSLCAHHLLPFFGSAACAYLPDKKVVGLSKLARLVECYARRLQVQERMTWQIANAMTEHLSSLGVAVVVKARHMCMEARGVEKQGSTAVTSAMLGKFRTESSLRQETMALIGEMGV